VRRAGKSLVVAFTLVVDTDEPLMRTITDLADRDAHRTWWALSPGLYPACAPQRRVRHRPGDLLGGRRYERRRGSSRRAAAFGITRSSNCSMTGEERKRPDEITPKRRMSLRWRRGRASRSNSPRTRMRARRRRRTREALRRQAEAL